MNVARIVNGIVTNIEVMDKEYLYSIKKNEKDTLVVIPENIMVVIGNYWSQEEGFVGSSLIDKIELTKPEGINEVLDPKTLLPIED